MRSAGKELPKPKGKSISTIGAFLNLGNRKLADEKTASAKLIEAYSSWVYINSSVLAENVGQIELKLYQVGYSQGQLDLKEIIQHPLLELLDKFNDSMTSSEGFYTTEAHLNLAGDAFWYIPRANGKPSTIIPLRPDRVTVNLGDFTDASKSIIEGYTYKEKINNKVVEQKYNPEEILHIKVPNPGNMFRGKSTVEAIANDIDIDTYSGETIREFFENGMIIDFALSTPQRLNNDQITNFQSQLRRAYGGAKKAWNVPIFGGDLKPVELQMSNKDSQLIENMKWFRDKIMIAFHNTPASLGIIEDVNRANSESTLNNWKQSTIRPKMKRIVDALNEYLVPLYGSNLILGFENPAPEDDADDIDESINLYKAQIITKNEARDKIGYDAIAGGDEFATTASPFGELPAPVKNVNYKAVFRKQGVIKAFEEYKRKYNAALPKVKKMLASKNKTEINRPVYSFDYSKVDKYAADQLKIVDHHEQIFSNAVTQLINGIVEEGMSNVDKPEARKKSQLVDKDKWLDRSVAKLEPILTQMLIQAGNHANRLLNIDQPYIPKSLKAIDTKEFIRAQILKFMDSAIDTDIDTMVDLIAAGLSDEQSVSQIRSAILDKFQDLTTVQANRITRTEVIKTSNAGAQDAFEQSGVVEAKQWLATEDDRTDAECSEMDGKIVGLDENYFDKGDKFMGLDLSYDDVEYPPLHANCRCVILPVLIGEKGLFENPLLKKENVQLKEKVAELENKVDKRTKGYKELKAKHLDDAAYIKSLEAYIDGQAT